KTDINPAVIEEVRPAAGAPESAAPAAKATAPVAAQSTGNAKRRAQADDELSDEDLAGSRDPLDDVDMPSSPTKGGARRKAQQRKLQQKRNQGPIIFAVILFFGLLGVLAFGFWLMGNRDGATTAAPLTPPPTGTGFTPPVGPPQMPGATGQNP